MVAGMALERVVHWSQAAWATCVAMKWAQRMDYGVDASPRRMELNATTNLFFFLF
jgi:hypothetical protein